MKILIVDDKEEERYLAETLLKESGYEVVTAVNGAEALEKLRAEGFDMIVSDILMPVMDGFQLCRECKGNEKLKDIPFVFHTAEYEEEEDEKLALKLGANKFIRKPIEPEEFIKVIQGVFRDLEEAKKKPATVGMKILVVEDNEDSRNLLVKQLRAYGHEVIAAADGAEALEQALAQPPDIIVSDILMPKMDGYQLCRECKQNEQLKNIPFIFYTATYTREEDEKFALSLGAETFIVKPTEPDVLVQKLSEIVEKAKSSALPPAEVAPLEPSTFLAEHDKRIFAKLEDKVAQLQAEITERKKAEDSLRESEKNLIKGQEIGQMGYWKLNPVTEEVEGSDELFKIFELGHDELALNAFADAVHPEDREYDLEHIQRGIEKGIPWDIEYRLLLKNGSIKWIRAIGEPNLDENGKVIQIIGIAQDITERKRAEEEIKENRDYLERLTNSMWDTVFLVRMPERVIEWVNDSFNLIGYDPKECVGGTTEFIYPNKNEFLNFGNKLKNAIDAGKDVLHSEQLLRRKNGDVFPADVTATIIRNQEGKVVSVTSIIRDITERKRAEEALRESEENLRAYLESAPDGIYINDLKGTFLYGNKKAEEITGYKREELIGKSFLKLELLPGKHMAKAAKLLALNAMGKPTGSDEFEVIRKDGSHVWVEIATTPIKQQESTVVIGFVRDITERKQAEEGLRIKDNAIASSINGIAIADLEGNITYVNHAFLRMWGYDDEKEVLGKNAAEFWQVVEKAVEVMQETMDRVGWIGELTAKRKDGSNFEVQLAASVVRDEAGKPICRSTSFVDITERKQAEEKARELGTLKELDRLRSGLLANVSHELRTPLTSIKGFASTLLDPEVKWSEEEQRDFLQTIDQESDRLIRLINDLLDMSRLEASALKLERDKYQVSEILGSISDRLTKLTEHHQLKVIVPAELPPVSVDETRIGQVLTNLVENATKFSPEGSEITIEAQLAGDQINVSVTDRGQGIAPELLDKVFDRFYQAESIVAGRKSGTGLGLSICRGIIEAHGGKIWVESKVGEGSKFSFSLPVSKGNEENA